MHLLDRFPNSELGAFNTSPERKLCEEYYKTKQQRLDKTGSVAQYISIRMDENGELVPCFAPESMDKIKSIYSEQNELLRREQFLLGKIDRISEAFPDIDVRELYRQRQALLDKIKGLQLFPVELEEARQKYTSLEGQIAEYTAILNEQYS